MMRSSHSSLDPIFLPTSHYPGPEMGHQPGMGRSNPGGFCSPASSYSPGGDAAYQPLSHLAQDGYQSIGEPDWQPEDSTTIEPDWSISAELKEVPEEREAIAPTENGSSRLVPPDLPERINIKTEKNSLELQRDTSLEDAPAHSEVALAGPDVAQTDTRVEAAATEEHGGFLPVLQNFNFLALWSGQVFSQLADKVYLVLMIALIASRFQAEDQPISGWVSSIMIAFTIPAVLFGSIAGAYVDRWSKKLVLVVTNLLRGVLVLVLPPLLWISQGWSPLMGLPLGFSFLLVTTFLVSTLTQFFAPAEQAVIPLVVDRRHLLSANSLYTTTMMASVIVGFAVGEPLLALADHLTAQLFGGPGIGKEILVGGGYVIAGLILLLINPKEKIDRSHLESIHVWADIRDGLRYLKQQHRVRNALIQLVILFSVFAALAVLAVRLAELIPGIRASQFGFLLAAGGVGMAIGATILGHFGKRLGSHTQLSLYGSFGIAAALVGLALFPLNLWVVLLLLMLVGGFAALVGVPMQTTIQAETPEEMRGKVFGLQNNAVNIALSLPLALAGVAETFLGIHAVFLGLAGLTIAGGFLTWYISVKKF